MDENWGLKKIGDQHYLELGQQPNAQRQIKIPSELYNQIQELILNKERYLKPHEKQVKETTEPNLLLDANRLIDGEKAKAYGDPFDQCSRIAAYWSVYLGKTIDPLDVAPMMMLLKISREQTNHSEDNLLDMAGYARVAQKARSTRDRREHERKTPVVVGDSVNLTSPIQADTKKKSSADCFSFTNNS